MKNLENQKSRDLFLEYKKKTILESDNHTYLKEKFPDQSFPKSAASVWRLAVLSEFWRHFHLTIMGVE